ncbi:MAG: lysozyme inhibitor LprI family protein [Acidithiobacillus sp.]
MSYTMTQKTHSGPISGLLLLGMILTQRADAATYETSFYCAKAITATESAICHDEHLAALDRQMAKNYGQLTVTMRQARNYTEALQYVTESQKKWLQERNACRADTFCITNAYGRRLAALNYCYLPDKPTAQPAPTPQPKPVPEPKPGECSDAITEVPIEVLQAAYGRAQASTLGVFQKNLNDALKHPTLSAQINSKGKLAHFLAQTAHETEGGRSFTEDLKFKANRLRIFGYFQKHGDEAWQHGRVTKEFIDFLNKNPKEAEKYGKTPIISYSEVHGADPEAIANRAYSNRYGNRGVESGDGWRYRGRGMTQLTFKDNYKNITKSFQQLHKTNISFFDNPDLVATPEYAMKTALVFWQQRHIGGTIDAPAGRETDVSTTNKTVTKIVNGGTNGLADRLSRLKKLLALPFFKKCEEAAKKTTALITHLLGAFT